MLSIQFIVGHLFRAVSAPAMVWVESGPELAASAEAQEQEKAEPAVDSETSGQALDLAGQRPGRGEPTQV
jgi:hypothetical protein